MIKLSTYQKEKYRAYRIALASLSDDVVLSLATREFNMLSRNSCVAGWALREVLAKARREAQLPSDKGWPPDADEEYINGPLYQLGMLNGNKFDIVLSNAWHDLFGDVMGPDLSLVELAFVDRVDEAVTNASN